MDKVRLEQCWREIRSLVLGEYFQPCGKCKAGQGSGGFRTVRKEIHTGGGISNSILYVRSSFESPREILHIQVL